MNDGRTGVLAVGKLTLGSHFGVSEERESDELVVFARFRILQNLREHFIVLATQMEVHITEGGVRKKRQRFRRHLHNGLPFEFSRGDAFLREEVVLRVVLAALEHRRVLKSRCLCHLLLPF